MLTELKKYTLPKGIKVVTRNEVKTNGKTRTVIASGLEGYTERLGHVVGGQFFPVMSQSVLTDRLDELHPGHPNIFYMGAEALYQYLKTLPEVSEVEGSGRNVLLIKTQKDRIMWAGSGGYWHYADASDVIPA